MKSRIAASVYLFAMAGVVTIALTGCSGGNGTDGATASPSVNSEDAQREVAFRFAKCMRENGNPNFPDPVKDVKGNWTSPAGTVAEEPPAACSELARTLRAYGIDEEKNVGEDMAKLVEFAKCMRETYKDFPDPDARGDFNLPASLVDTFNTRRQGNRPEAPCEEHIPPGHELSYVIPESS
ncbi:hypothetical protein ACFP2T_02600 [Plantactinospora solaniradicis]|uniref:Lipoprotein n=1 Tax=Plantactinospora solaniradicis TaxID=1723736 RepID=A0ABW1K1B1_9ACTN